MSGTPVEPRAGGSLHERARSLFDAVTGDGAAARGVLLAAARERDPEACAEVEALLAAHDGRGVLDQSAAEAAAPLVGPVPADPGEVLPRRLGEFTLERVLGRGGMGVVYEAHQAFPSRRVAVKLVRPEVVSASLVRRFVQEAQTLALLQHDGIARLYQAGHATGGAPFIVMELVEGRAITAWADERGIGDRARMDLMARVCDAVEHAHRRGVIHRDLKPGNILVDGGGQPKVLDFGVARLVQRDGSATGATLHGQLVGTLGYMSPEQVDGDPALIDTRSDVYALGAVLYELLAGGPPVDVSVLTLAQAATAARDREPLPLGQVRAELRGDIETIAGRALRVDPGRRYQSAAELAADLRRYLRGEPIEARRDSAMYLLQKRIKRYRWGIGVAAAFAAGIIGVAVWSGVMADRYRLLAVSEKAAKESATDAGRALSAQLRTSNLERGRLLVTAGAAPDGEAMLWDEHLRAPGAADSLWALRDTYARFPCRATLDASARALTTAAILPGGGVVAGGLGGVVRLWDADRREHATLPHGVEDVRSCAVVGNLRVVTGTDAGIVRLWSTGGELLATARMPTPGRTWVATPDDGAVIVAGGADGHVRLLDPHTLGVLADLGGHDGPVRGVKVSPDRRLAATVSSGEVRVWDLAGRTLVSAAPVARRDLVCVAWSHDSQRIAAGSAIGRIRLFAMPDLHADGVVTSEAAWTVRSVVFLPGDSRLAYATWWSIFTADAVDRGKSELFGLSGRPITEIALDRSGGVLASASEDGNVRLWDLSPDLGRRWLEPVGAGVGYLNDVVPLADGRAAVVNESGIVTLFGADGAPGPQVACRKARSFDIAASPDGRTLVWGGVTTLLNVIDLGTATVVREVVAVKESANSVRFSPDGAALAVMGTDGEASLWDTGDWTRRWAVDLGRTGRQVRFSPGGEQVVASSSAGVLLFLNAATGATIDERRGDFDYWGIDVDPLGRFVAVGTGERLVEVMDLHSRAAVAELRGHQEVPWSLAFSGDGALLATASSNGAIRLWDTGTWRCVMSVRDADAGLLFPLAFRPGTRRLLVGHGYRGASEWDFAAFDAFIAGNAEHQLRRARGALPADALTAAERWVAGLGGR
ncbi:MAG: protein kinase [Phycisphaerales bacterium]|nr:protein kinase [Phycisphaerales bacterium]